MPTQIILLNFETGGKKFIEFNEYSNHHILNPRPILSNLSDIKNVLI